MTKRLALLAIISLFMVGCTTAPANEEGGGDTSNTTNENTSTDTTPEDSTEEQVDYTIDMQSFSFSLSEIEVKAGETIKVKIQTKSGAHDFVIDELDVRSRILATGEDQVIEITAPADSAGESYAFYCSVGSHRSLGMEGTISVI